MLEAVSVDGIPLGPGYGVEIEDANPFLDTGSLEPRCALPGPLVRLYLLRSDVYGRYERVREILLPATVVVSAGGERREWRLAR